MSRYITPRKKFNFRIRIHHPGNIQELEAFHVQTVTLPESNIEQVEHGHGNTIIKTAGKVTLTNLVIGRILEADSARFSDYFWSWHRWAMDAITNTGGLAASYKKTIIIEELRITEIDGYENIPIEVRYLEGCWPCKINGKEYDRTDSDNIIDSVEFSVDFIY